MRGQFQILAALALALLMITARTMTISDYSINLQDVDAQVSSINQQATRAVLTALAYASNAPPAGNVALTYYFKAALNSALANVTESNYGLSMYATTPLAASASWTGEQSFTSATANISITSTSLRSSWSIQVLENLTQSVQAGGIRSSKPFAELVTFSVPVNFTLNQRAAHWVGGQVTFNNNTVPIPVSISKNYGNGVLEVQFSLPLTSSYGVELEMWDGNQIAVMSAFSLVPPSGG